jgi:hypothetical protein
VFKTITQIQTQKKSINPKNPNQNPKSDFFQLFFNFSIHFLNKKIIQLNFEFKNQKNKSDFGFGFGLGDGFFNTQKNVYSTQTLLTE